MLISASKLEDFVDEIYDNINGPINKYSVVLIKYYPNPDSDVYDKDLWKLANIFVKEKRKLLELVYHDDMKYYHVLASNSKDGIKYLLEVLNMNYKDCVAIAGDTRKDVLQHTLFLENIEE